MRVYGGIMRETTSYQDVFDGVNGDNGLPILGNYDFFEVGNCARALSTFAPDEWNDICSVLREFVLTGDLLCASGGNDGPIPETINDMFNERGWSEKQIDIETTVYAYDRNDLSGMKRRVQTQLRHEHLLEESDVDDIVQSSVDLANVGNPLGDELAAYVQSSVIDRSYQPGYYVDNCKGRVLVDVEWNAKDGNMDRDFAAYRAWYEAGAIDGAVVITKEIYSCRELLDELERNFEETHPEMRGKMRFARLGTTTTVSLTTARKRLRRGGAGACPVLIVAIGRKTWDQSMCTGQMLRMNAD